MTHTINYHLSFMIFWGLTFALAIFTGGILNFAFVAMAILMVVWHEHAHAAHTLRVGGEIKEIGFTWLGGYVIADLYSPVDLPEFFMAGVKNTCAITVTLIALNYSVLFYCYEFIFGFNFAMNPYLNFLNCIVVFAVLMSLCNLLPISYYWKAKDMLVTTDCWAAWMYFNLRNELPMDSRIIAAQYSNTT